jgi:putative hydrolase of the HAD superfamily
MIDVDGVLVRGRPSDGRPWGASIEADLGLTVADLQREFFVPHWSDIVIGRRDLAGALTPVLARIAPQVSYQEFIDYWFENDAALDTELLAALQQVRENGTKIYLATNQEHVRAAYLYETLGLSQYCDEIFYSAALGFRKPDRGFFDKAALLSGTRPEQLVLVDDTLDNVVAARAAGWNAVAWSEDSSLSAVLSQLEQA